MLQQLKHLYIYDREYITDFGEIFDPSKILSLGIYGEPKFLNLF
jgi:hypothetical protein